MLSKRAVEQARYFLCDCYSRHFRGYCERRMSEPTLISIYVLSDPLTGEFRYVGTTTRSLKVRLQGHISATKEPRKDRNHNAIWIRSLLAQGLKPNIQLLETVDGDVKKNEKKWILYGRQKGWDLTNHWGREPIKEERHKREVSKYKSFFGYQL